MPPSSTPREPRLIIRPKKGTPEWYKWIVNGLSKAHAVPISKVTNDGALQGAIQHEAENQIRRALIELLQECGVFKRVEEIKLPKEGDNGN